jgi:hypothetical protein
MRCSSGCASVVGPAPHDADGLDWLAGMSPGNIDEFTRARSGEPAYRPLVEQLARDAVAAVHSGRLPVADGYELAESDRAALAGQQQSPGHLFRTKAAYIGGIDGWIDDGIALTRSWAFESPASAGRYRYGTAQMTRCARARILTGFWSTCPQRKHGSCRAATSSACRACRTCTAGSFRPLATDPPPRAVRQWPSAGPMFQACRPASIAGYGLDSTDARFP